MLKRAKLSTKLIGTMAGILMATAAASFWITQRRINRQAEDGFRDKVRQITGMATATRVWFSQNIDVLVPDKNFKSLQQVPVVVAWSVAQRYAESQEMTFHTPSLRPRNPKNQPDEFERRALEKFQQNPSLKEYSERRVEEGEEVMRYAQPVRLTPDCLLCHGDPEGTKDPFGYTKEGMKAGDLRGAFTVRASTQGLVENARANSLAIFLTSFLTLLIAAGAMWAMVEKMLVRPLKASVELANAISENDLAVNDLAVESEDEIGQANAALNTMKNNLRHTVQNIAETALRVNNASHELTSTSQLISANSEETSSQANVVAEAAQHVNRNLQTVATGAEEMGISIREIAKNATEAARIATSAVKVSQDTTAAVSKLGESSSEIGEVIKVITAIAEQTNLLALNATIEAARAGEAGKGFAVVANEVKELAKETSGATEEIGRKIEDIQRDTKGAVEAIASISQVINQINGISNTIATAVEEQNATTNEMTRNVGEAAQGSGEITSNISGVAQAAASTSEGARDTQKAAQQLAESSSELQQLVDQFRLQATGPEADRKQQRRAAQAGV
ncbi:MAG TPA: methyl-accepting chemotaxis protein [Candidatus Binatia bacterium]|nr:methyl-accepting chemotaxis protein [Candidatus Binatia bacterium]